MSSLFVNLANHLMHLNDKPNFLTLCIKMSLNLSLSTFEMTQFFQASSWTGFNEVERSAPVKILNHGFKSP